jgi:hypothetical protein
MRATATARRAESDTNRTLAFWSKSIPIGHRNGHVRRPPIITGHATHYLANLTVATGANARDLVERTARTLVLSP